MSDNGINTGDNQIVRKVDQLFPQKKKERDRGLEIDVDDNGSSGNAAQLTSPAAKARVSVMSPVSHAKFQEMLENDELQR